MHTCPHTYQYRLIPAIVALTAALTPALAAADAGVIRATVRHDERRITVFTDPTPLRAGPIDVSVLVQDLTAGAPILDAEIEVHVAPRGQPAAGATYRAANQAATNKLLHAAHFDLPQAGNWEFTVTVANPGAASDTVRFEAKVAEPLPAWQAVWQWFCWPLVVAALWGLAAFSRPKAAGTKGIGG